MTQLYFDALLMWCDIIPQRYESRALRGWIFYRSLTGLHFRRECHPERFFRHVFIELETK